MSSEGRHKLVAGYLNNRLTTFATLGGHRLQLSLVASVVTLPGVVPTG